MLKQFFDISTGFRFSKLQWGSVPSIPVAVLALVNKIGDKTEFTITRVHCIQELSFKICKIEWRQLKTAD